MLKRFLVVLLLVGQLSLAAPTIISGPVDTLRPFTFAAVKIPVSAEDVYVGDCYLTEITLTNTSASAVTVTILDKQGTPQEVLSAVSVAGNTTYVIAFEARFMSGGIRWVASSGTAIVGSMRFKK